MSTSMKMRAALFFGSGDVRIQDVDIPRVARGEVLVKIGTALTCGSDFKAFRQGHPVLLGETYPAPFGHELAGTIVKVGKGANGFQPGQRVVAANSAPCDDCSFCRIGRPNLCDNLKLLNGAYAEFIRIPSQIVRHNLYAIPSHLGFKAAALSEPLACAVHAFRRLSIQRDDTIVILGCGIMGLLLSCVAKIHGAHVIAVGRNEKKLARARMIGVDQILDVKTVKNPVQAILDLTPGARGADFVVEAVGLPEAWEQAVSLVHKGGTVCLFGGCKRGTRFSVDTHRVHYEEVNVMGVFHHTPQDFAEALHYLSEGLIYASHFVTLELSLEDISKYFRRVAYSSPFKAAVIP